MSRSTVGGRLIAALVALSAGACDVDVFVTPPAPPAPPAPSAPTPSVAPVAQAPGPWVEVEGWPGWLCADLDGGRSAWRLAHAQGTEGTWSGTCASWRRAPPAGPLPIQFTLPQPSAFVTVEGWPDWRCADLADGVSVWHPVGQPATVSRAWTGSCASWRRPVSR